MDHFQLLLPFRLYFFSEQKSFFSESTFLPITKEPNENHLLQKTNRFKNFVRTGQINGRLYDKDHKKQLVIRENHMCDRLNDSNKSNDVRGVKYVQKRLY